MSNLIKFINILIVLMNMDKQKIKYRILICLKNYKINLNIMIKTLISNIKFFNYKIKLKNHIKIIILDI